MFNFGPNGIQDEIILTRKTKLSINALAQLLPLNYRFVISCTAIMFLCITLIIAVTTPLQGKTLAAPTNLQVTITGNAPPPTNQPPTVSAGSNQTITRPASASLSGTASDDGLPSGNTLTTTWSKSSGPGTVTFGNIHALSTTASFSTAGTYMLQLTATDGALTATSTVTITVNAAPPGMQWSMGFYTPFGQPSPIADIDWAALTHVVQVGVVPNADGSLTDMSQGTTAALVSAAHTNGAKVLLNIQPSSNMASAVTNHLSTFVSNIMVRVNTNGYDGVDVDWEVDPTATLIQSFIPAMRTALGTKLLTVDAQLFGFSLWFPVASQLDRINVMTYDMGGTNFVDSWFNSPLYGTSSQYKAIGNIDQMRIKWVVNQGWPAEKINIGIPFFGIKSLGGSPVITGPRQMFGTTLPAISEIRYNDLIAGFIISNSIRDTDSHTPWLPITNGWISYDDDQSVTEKVQYVKAENLGGWIIWELNSDYLPLQSPKHPLLNAVKLAR